MLVSNCDFWYWHKCEVPTVLSNVRFQQPRRHLLALSSSQFDPSRHLAAAQQRIALSSTMEVGWALGHVGDVPNGRMANTTLS
jgi:hypothetical protein